MEYKPKPSDDWQDGYHAGWAAHQEYLRDSHQLRLDTGDYGSSLVLGIMLTVFGGLFVMAGVMQAARFGFELWPFVIGVPAMTGAFFALKGLRKARQKGRDAERKFKEKWGE